MQNAPKYLIGKVTTRSNYKSTSSRSKHSIVMNARRVSPTNQIWGNISQLHTKKSKWGTNVSALSSQIKVFEWKKIENEHFLKECLDWTNSCSIFGQIKAWNQSRNRLWLHKRLYVLIKKSIVRVGLSVAIQWSGRKIFSLVINLSENDHTQSNALLCYCAVHHTMCIFIEVLFTFFVSTLYLLSI